LQRPKKTGLPIPEDLKRECKALAAKQGIPFYEWVIQALQAKLQKN